MSCKNADHPAHAILEIAEKALQRANKHPLPFGPELPGYQQLNGRLVSLHDRQQQAGINAVNIVRSSMEPAMLTDAGKCFVIAPVGESG